MAQHMVFVTGATGYLGRALIPALLARGHRVRALARPEGAARVPPGAEIVTADALVPASYAAAIAPADTLVHLIGTPHPSPAKAASFRSVDLASVGAMLEAVRASAVRHVVYVSVAQPAPLMQAYVQARQAAEAQLRASGLSCTILRPWYVLGPGHRWPYLIMPFTALLERLPWTRASARRLGFVTLAQMVQALVAAVQRPGEGVRIVEVPQIRLSNAD
jgi:uncharacterized protein YbjT (DUF2867 family)